MNGDRNLCELSIALSEALSSLEILQFVREIEWTNVPRPKIRCLIKESENGSLQKKRGIFEGKIVYNFLLDAYLLRKHINILSIHPP